MDEADRSRILLRLPELCNKLSYKPLKEHCLRSRLISDTMIREIEKHVEDSEEKRLERLLTKITKRGPDAFRTFVHICTMAFPEALKVMSPNLYNYGEFRNSGGSLTNRRPNLLPPPPPPLSTLHEHRTLELKPFLADVEPYEKMPKFVFSKKFHVHPKVQVYKMHSRNRGVLFLVNIINFKLGKDRRTGADADRNNLVWLFRKMGFVIFYYEDIQYNEFNSLLEQLKESDYLRYTDCFVFGLMTHGSRSKEQERVEFASGESPEIQEIISKFYNDSCDLLRYKPKIFILPYCRGDQSDPGVHLQANRVETDGRGIKVSSKQNLPTKSDILIVYGTVPDYVTHRDVTEGSWFIQVLCNVFAQHAHDTDLEVMLKIVMARIMTEYRTDQMNVQTPSVESWGFRSALFFNPGHYSS